MKLFNILIMFLALCVLTCAADSSRDGIRPQMDAAISALPLGIRGSNEYIREFGLGKSYLSQEAFCSLAVAVSNSFQLVYSSFNEYATNELEKSILLACGWAFNDEYYKRCYSNNLDLVEGGMITRDDFKWFVTGSRDERRANILGIEFDQPGVSNLIFRQQALIGDTNFCQRALSGATRNFITNYISELSR